MHFNVKSIYETLKLNEILACKENKICEKWDFLKILKKKN